MVYGSQFTYYEDVLLPGRSRVELSLPGAIAPALLLMFSMFHGRLCDSHYHRYINVGGSILLISGFFCLTFSSGAGNAGDGNYGIIVLAYVLQGLGQSSFFVTSSHIASSWYPDRPAIPIGITSCGVAIAGIIWPVMFQEGASAWGFRNAVGGMTGLVILLCLFVCIFGMPDPDTPSRPLSDPLSLNTWIDPNAVKSLEWIFATASTCLIYLALLVIPQFMEDWAMVQGLSNNSDQAVLLLTIAMGCSLIGRLGGSYVAGMFGFRIAHSVFCLAQMVWIFVWWNLASTWSHAIAFAVVTGALIGAIITLPPGGMKEIVHKSTPNMTSIGSSPKPITRDAKMEAAQHSEGVSATSTTTNSSMFDLEAHQAAHPTTHADRSASVVTAMETMAVVTPGDEDSNRGSQERNRLGQWLGTSFLFAAPFVLTGNLATSRLVAGTGGILAAGWWAGACYGGASVCLLLSVLATKLTARK